MCQFWECILQGDYPTEVLQDSIFRKKHWPGRRSLSVRQENILQVTPSLPSPLHGQMDPRLGLQFSLHIFRSTELTVAGSAQQVELPADLLAPGHPVDHDVGQGVPPLPPAAEAVAVEPDTVEPLKGLLRILSLKTDQISSSPCHCVASDQIYRISLDWKRSIRDKWGTSEWIKSAVSDLSDHLRQVYFLSHHSTNEINFRFPEKFLSFGLVSVEW